MFCKKIIFVSEQIGNRYVVVGFMYLIGENGFIYLFWIEFCFKKNCKVSFCFENYFDFFCCEKKEFQIVVVCVYNELNDYLCEYMLIVFGWCM